MKSLERILLQYLVSLTKEKLDPCQFAYKQGCGTEDAVATLVHLITKHLDQSREHYARVLFVLGLFSSLQHDTVWYIGVKDGPVRTESIFDSLVCMFLNQQRVQRVKGEQNPFLSINYKCWRSTGLCKLSCTLHSLY